MMVPTVNSSLAPVHVITNGFMVMTTFLLTGEERSSYNQWLTPQRPFDPSHPFTSPGAWELVARLSHLEMSDNVFAPGPGNFSDPSQNSRLATELTLGFNWYANRWVRVQFNWEHSWFETSVAQENAILNRFQIIF